MGTNVKIINDFLQISPWMAELIIHWIFPAPKIELKLTKLKANDSIKQKQSYSAKRFSFYLN